MVAVRVIPVVEALPAISWVAVMTSCCVGLIR